MLPIRRQKKCCWHGVPDISYEPYGFLERKSAIPPIDALTPEMNKQLHTSYAKGSIEGAVVNILVDSGASELFLSV